MGTLERLTKTYASAFKESSRSVFLHFINISLRYNYIYTATPKVACSTMLQTLQRLELADKSFLHDPASEIHNRQFSPLLTPLQLADFCTYSERLDVTKFCFVRNPFDRLLSCYLEKVREGHLSSRFLAKLGREQGPVSFAEFIQVVEAESTEEMEPHYGVQYLQTFHEYIKYDFVGRFECLATDIVHLSHMLGVDLSPYLVRIDPHRTGKKDFASYFDGQASAFVRKRYDQDFEAFGYSRDLPK